MEKIPKGKIPEVGIGKEQAEDLKTVSAVTKMLAENPEMAREMADIFEQIAKEKEKELTERISKLLAEKVKDVSVERIGAAMQYWYPWVIRYWGPWYPWVVQYWYPWYAGRQDTLGVQR